jgi:hypothetical protein
MTPRASQRRLLRASTAEGVGDMRALSCDGAAAVG